MDGVIETEKQVIIDGTPVNKLPDCPKCGRNEYYITPDTLKLVCPCGAIFWNKGRI